MDEREKQVVALIKLGYSRHEIAEELDVGQTSVKHIVKRLCLQHQCRMRDLPRVLEKENSDASSDEEGQ